jgi:NitT/TauT family transport system permease protein
MTPAAMVRFCLVRGWLPSGWLPGAVGVAALLAAAMLAGLVVPPGVLPPAPAVLAQAARLAADGRFLADVASTLQAWALGLLLTTVIAVPIGVILGSLPGVRYAVRAVAEFLRPLPPVALILLVSLAAGPGLRLTLTLTVYGCAWPVLYNTIAGIENADPVARDTLRAFGFGPLSVALRVALPGAAPFIAAGIRIASSLALVLSIGSGYLLGRINGPGIGAFIADASTGAGNVTLVLAATAWAGLLGLALNALLTTIERALLPWHRASLAGQVAR